MATKSDYRVESIQKITYNGKKCKMFKVYKLIGRDFIFMGNWTAPLKVKNEYLWQVYDLTS